MVEIEYQENLDEKFFEIIDSEFNKYAIKNGVECNYKSFSFIAKINNEIIGIITGNSYYQEVHIDNLIVLEQYRKQHIGSKLMEKVENHFKNKGFKNINLTTYEFQAPEFYKKCGFEVEFVRENKENSKLNKYFLIKYFN